MKDLLGDHFEAGALQLGEPGGALDSSAVSAASLRGGATLGAALDARPSPFVTVATATQGGAGGGGGGVHAPAQQR